MHDRWVLHFGWNLDVSSPDTHMFEGAKKYPAGVTLYARVGNVYITYHLSFEHVVCHPYTDPFTKPDYIPSQVFITDAAAARATTQTLLQHMGGPPVRRPVRFSYQKNEPIY